MNSIRSAKKYFSKFSFILEKKEKHQAYLFDRLQKILSSKRYQLEMMQYRIAKRMKDLRGVDFTLSEPKNWNGKNISFMSGRTNNHFNSSFTQNTYSAEGINPFETSHFISQLKENRAYVANTAAICTYFHGCSHTFCHMEKKSDESNTPGSGGYLRIERWREKKTKL